MVTWTLGQACGLRPARDPEDLAAASPGRALTETRLVRCYEDGVRDRSRGYGVYGDVCVTMTGGGSPMIPTHGFIISREFAPYGGIAGIQAMCGSCPANTAPARLARCAGWLDQDPDSPEMEEQLQGIISRLGLAAEMAECFPATKPLWYGLWAVSPVPVKTLPVLGRLLEEVLAEDQREMALRLDSDEEHVQSFTRIIAAIARAEIHGLPLHVGLSPPGHTDFGVLTSFAHCPLCKATATGRGARWEGRHDTEQQSCWVCGTRFVPAETYSRAPMTWEWEGEELKDKLGEEGYRSFLREYLRACGEPQAEVERVIAAMEYR